MSVIKSKNRRIKTNFMISDAVLSLLKKSIAAGDRSDFVNRAIENQLLLQTRAKGAALLEKFRKAHQFSFSDEQIIEAKNYGRE